MFTCQRWSLLALSLWLILAGGVCAGAAPAVPAAARAAAEPLDEVIVSAQLRARPRSETPASTTVLSTETIEAAGQQHLQDLLGLVPNLNWAAGTSRPRYYQLRGVGELEQWLGAPNPSVALIIDGVDFSGVGTPATLYDIEQVEVVRGPQGTSFGANALAGVIALRSKAPTRDFYASGELTVANYRTGGAGAVVSGPLDANGDVALRLAAQTQRGDGFRRNAFLDRDDTNGLDETTVRGRLRVATAPDWNWDVAALWFDIDNGYDAFSIDNSRVTLSDRPGRDAQRSGGLSSRIEYRHANYSLVGVTGWQDSDVAYSFDGDWGNPVSWGDNGPYDFFQRFDRQRRVLTQDIRIESAADAAIEWVLGAYGAHAVENTMQRDRFDGATIRALDSRYRARNVAAYGEFATELLPRVALSVGGRVERRNAVYRDNESNDFSPTETMWGGNITLTHRLGTRHSTYVTMARGYKAGGFNLGVAVPQERRLFDAETLTNAEFGINGRSLTGRLDYSGAVFYMRRRDQQVDTSLQLVPGDPLTFILLTDNAARGANKGVEATLAWQASPRWSLGGSLAWLDAKFTAYRSGDRDMSGRQQPHAPKFQGSAFAQLSHPHGWFARLDLTMMDRFFYSLSHEERAPAYSLVNVKAGFQGERLDAELWVRNAFNTYWSHRGFYFGNEPPDFPNKRYTQAGDPRQVGLTLRYTVVGAR